MSDHYTTLGINRNATAEEIQQAYRRAAMKHHPDRGGDAAEFQKIQQAYTVLSDAQQRQQYDNPNPFGSNGFQFGFDNGFPPEFQNMFGHFFRQTRNIKPQVRVQTELTLEEAAAGVRKTFNINGRVIDVEVPSAIDSGQEIRYPNCGPNDSDLIIVYVVLPHSTYTREGLNLKMQRDLDFWDLILGTEIEIQKLDGTTLKIQVPARTRPSAQLRVRQQGLAARDGNAGDIIIAINAVLPNNISDAVVEAIQQSR